MSIDFGSYADIYSRHRRTGPHILSELLCFGDLTASSTVLEIGCGTANYLTALVQETGARGFGVDPAANMIAQAAELDPQFTRQLQVGSAEALPIEDGSVDFAFMVDVVHVVDDLDRMAAEAFRVLRPGGKFAIATDSEVDIRGTIPLRTYFPETVPVELQRYPSMDRLTAVLGQVGFAEIALVPVRHEYELTDISMYRTRAASSLRLISDEAHAAGMERLEAALAAGPIQAVSRYTVVEARKPVV